MGGGGVAAVDVAAWCLVLPPTASRRPLQFSTERGVVGSLGGRLGWLFGRRELAGLLFC